jgi:hypothetical protein
MRGYLSDIIVLIIYYKLLVKCCKLQLHNTKFYNLKSTNVQGGNINASDAPPVKICAYYSGFVTKICHRIYSNIYKAMLRAFKKSKI